MVARISRLLGIVALSVGCQTPSPALPIPEPPKPVHVTRIVFSVDVLDEAQICVAITPSMRFREPNIGGEDKCGLTVGELRAWLQRLSRAD